MYRNAAAIRGYGDNLMTGECSKIRSGEFLVFRSRCRCACVWVWLFMCPSKKLFSSSICVCPGPKGAYLYSYSLSGEYMLSNFRMHGVIMLQVEKADILSKQYQSVFSRDNAKDKTPNPTYNIPSMPGINIDNNGILKLLRDINTQKSVGPDLIPNRVLKECCAELTPIPGAIFRKSLALGQLPSDWLKANVIGIYKKGQKCEPSNYRPVSLTSVTCKLMEHIIYSQVMRHYTKHNFINGIQHGFLKGLSCDTQLVTTVEELQRGLDRKTQYDVNGTCLHMTTTQLRLWIFPLQNSRKISTYAALRVSFRLITKYKSYIPIRHLVLFP